MKNLSFVIANSRFNVKLDCFEFPNVKSNVGITEDSVMSEIMPNVEKQLRENLMNQTDPLEYLVGVIIVKTPVGQMIKNTTTIYDVADKLNTELRLSVEKKTSKVSTNNPVQRHISSFSRNRLSYNNNLTRKT